MKDGSLCCIVVEAVSARRGGSQTYLRNLFKHYTSKDSERVIVIVHEKSKEKFLNIHPNIEVLSPKFPSISLFHRWFWQYFILPRLLIRLQAKVVYFPGGSSSIRTSTHYKLATACRNMLPFLRKERSRYPVGYMRVRLWALRYAQSRLFQTADLLIFVSQYAKSIIDRKGDSIVIPHGVSDEFRVATSDLDRPDISNEFVLYVSIIDVYKAQIEVVRAWYALRQMRATRERLVLIGPEYAPYGRRLKREIRKLKLTEEVLILGDLPHSELPSYFHYAKVNLFASSCENCPNILLEALAAGKPVMCSSYEPMPEFASDSVQYFDPYSSIELASKLSVLLDDPDAQLELGNRAARRAGSFVWQEAADRTWASLRLLADQSA